MSSLILIGFKPFTLKLDRLTPTKAPHTLRMNSLTAESPMTLELCDKKSNILKSWEITSPANLQSFLTYVASIWIKSEVSSDKVGS